ncbi:DUF4396 domain-containing protein [Rhodopseudomonas palustris]|uniref:DUF4396 domain-containing protein n=1 Tax=Rhodopseudomonas palustris TaxID=1076 RepID=A0A323URT0_RHOPL|nr:DUF4396 domain-containing protein [Rhodopseudomonas palustris]PZA10368.1 DUF4396 domain-containing protein [Rhodopseudomonas palustris]
MIPHWLHLVAIGSLLLGALCASVIVVDEIRHPQRMWIMNAVWPLTALFGTVIWTWGYFRYGRLSAADAGEQPDKPFGIMVAEGASHCGSGCTLGDICAEWLAFAVPTIAVWLGWQSLFAEKIFAVWILDYIFAYVFGIVFQYYTIAPMRQLGVGAGLWAAVKADTLSLTAWQVGMYGLMALAQFWIFRRLFGVELEVASPEFWFVMQIAMLAGFATSYPVNWWLLRRGIKERM